MNEGRRNEVKSNYLKIFKELVKKKKQSRVFWLLYQVILGGRFWPSAWKALECVSWEVVHSPAQGMLWEKPVVISPRDTVENIVLED